MSEQCEFVFPCGARCTVRITQTHDAHYVRKYARKCCYRSGASTRDGYHHIKGESSIPGHNQLAQKHWENYTRDEVSKLLEKRRKLLSKVWKIDKVLMDYGINPEDLPDTHKPLRKVKSKK